jgi:hypothetical protein
VFAKELKECHEIVGTEGIEELLNDVLAFIQRFDVIKEKIAEEKAMAATEHTDEGKEPSTFSDPEQKARYAFHGPNFFNFLKQYKGVMASLDSLVVTFKDQMARFDSKMGSMDKEVEYSEILRQNKENVLQMIGVTASHADEFCS